MEGVKDEKNKLASPALCLPREAHISNCAVMTGSKHFMGKVRVVTRVQERGNGGHIKLVSRATKCEGRDGSGQLL